MKPRTFQQKAPRIGARIRALRDRQRKVRLGAERIDTEWHTKRVSLRGKSLRERAAMIKEERERDKFIQLKGKEFHKALRRERLPPSSVVNELIAIPVNNALVNVQVLLVRRWYTYFNVPNLVFDNWKEGFGAVCETDDYKKQKRWVRGKTPSLGAFFNQQIKYDYRWVRGRV